MRKNLRVHTVYVKAGKQASTLNGVVMKELPFHKMRGMLWDKGESRMKSRGLSGHLPRSSLNMSTFWEEETFCSFSFVPSIKKVSYLWFLSLYDSWLSNICFSYLKCYYSLSLPELTSDCSWPWHVLE